MELILILVIGCLLIRLYQISQKNKIYYNNYQQCLKALSDFDPKLKEYLERGK